MSSLEAKDDSTTKENTPLVHQRKHHHHKLSWIDDPAHACTVGILFLFLAAVISYTIPFFLGRALPNAFAWLALVPIFVVNGLLAAKICHFLYGDDEEMENEEYAIKNSSSKIITTASFFTVFTLVTMAGLFMGWMTSSYNEESDRILEGKFLASLCPAVKPSTLDSATRADTVTTAEWYPGSSVYNQTSAGNHTWTTNGQGGLLTILGNDQTVHWCLTVAPVIAPEGSASIPPTGCASPAGSMDQPLSVSFWAITSGQIDGNQNPPDDVFNNATKCKTPQMHTGAIIKDSRNMASLDIKGFNGHNEFKNAADTAKEAFLKTTLSFKDSTDSKYVVMTDTPVEDAEGNSDTWMIVFFSGLLIFMFLGLCIMQCIRRHPKGPCERGMK